MKKVQEEIIISLARQIKKEDISRWLKNALIFSAPALLVLLADVRELIPDNAAYGALLLAVYGMAIDLFKKWINENRYVKPVK